MAADRAVASSHPEGPNLAKTGPNHNMRVDDGAHDTDWNRASA